MFLGGGTLIELIEAKVKTLDRILREHVERRLTGYIIYRNTLAMIYAAIAIVDGNIVACRSIVNGVVVEGVECGNNIVRYLHSNEGIIEVYGVDRNTIMLDLTIFPISTIEEEIPLATLIGAKTGIPRAEIAIPELEKPSVVPTKPAVPKSRSIRIVDECMDPVLLYTVMKSSQLSELLRGTLTIRDVIQKVEDIVEKKRPRYIYVSIVAEGISIRLVYNGQDDGMNIELEKGGAIKCGREALESLIGYSFSEAKIWVAP